MSHSGGIPQCDDTNKLTNNTTVVGNLLPDIKPNLGFPAFPPAAPAPLVSAQPVAPEIAALHLVDSGVTDGVTNTHTLTIPFGLPSATFAAMWVPGDAPPSLTVQVLRPGGTPVGPSDADVLQALSMDGSANSLYVAASGFTIANPSAGDWSVRVTGVATGPAGAPYIASVFPDSNVSVSANTTADVVLAGGAQTATAQLLDGNTPVAATISARLIKVDGSEQTMTLVDDGTNGDAVAGDQEYSRSISTSGACGTVRLLVSADATGTSEGSVHREQVASFDVHVPGDAVRDPCNPDDDGDVLTDDAEFNVYHTNPLNPDTDGDGLLDGAEVNTYLTNPLNPDTDGDGLLDGAEVNTYATNPLNPDTDGDLVSDGALATAGVSAGPDNCPTIANGLAQAAIPGVGNQTNTDGGLSYLWIRDGVGAEGATLGGDACDTNDDNDGCTDVKEAGADWHTGGQRDRTSPWDFFDVPVPALKPSATTGVRNKFITLADVLADLAYVGTSAANSNTVNANGAMYGSDINGNGIPDGREYDRTPSIVPGETWHTGAPNGFVTLADVLAVLGSVGSNCS